MRRTHKPCCTGALLARALRPGAAAGLMVVLTGMPWAVATAQSPFNLIGLGGTVESFDARMDGRGGWGMAVQDTLVPGFKNLAGLAGLNAVTMQLSGYGETNQSEASGEKRRTYRVFTPNVRGAIPLFGSRLALSAGFQALRSTQYSTISEQTWITEADTVRASELFVREGTQFSIPIGLSYRVLPRLSLGASVNLARGTIREILTDFFTEPLNSSGQPLYVTTSLTEEDEFSGTSATFSLLMKPHERFLWGASYTPAHDIELKHTVALANVAGSRETRRDMRMPLQWSAGWAYHLSDRWLTGLDYTFSEFSRLEGPPELISDAEDEWILAFGLEREGARKRRGGLENLPLRVGAMLHRWGYRVGGEPVDETRLSVGTGFPLSKGQGHLDVAVSYGMVGDLAKNGNEDRYWRLSVSVAGLEKWW